MKRIILGIFLLVAGIQIVNAGYYDLQNYKVVPDTTNVNTKYEYRGDFYLGCDTYTVNLDNVQKNIILYASGTIHCKRIEADNLAVIVSSLAVGSVYPAACQSGSYSNISIPAANVNAGSLGASVVASSIAVNAVYPSGIGAGNLPNNVIASSVAINSIPINAIQSGTLPTNIIASSVAVNAVYPEGVRAGTLPSNVIASSVAANALYPLAPSNVIAGTLPSNVIASSIAVNAVQDSSIVSIAANKINPGNLPLGVTVQYALAANSFLGDLVTISSLNVTSKAYIKSLTVSEIENSAGIINKLPSSAGDLTGLDVSFYSSPPNWQAAATTTQDGQGVATGVHLSKANVFGNYYTDLYSIDVTTLTVSDYIRSVTVYAQAYIFEKDENDYDAVSIKTHGTVYNGTAIILEQGWNQFSQTWTVNPYTGTFWTADEVNALQIGVRLMCPSFVGESCNKVSVGISFGGALLINNPYGVQCAGGFQGNATTASSSTYASTSSTSTYAQNVPASGVIAGTLPSTVIVSSIQAGTSIAAASVQAGSLGASVIASSVAVNSIYQGALQGNTSSFTYHICVDSAIFAYNAGGSSSVSISTFCPNIIHVGGDVFVASGTFNPIYGGIYSVQNSTWYITGLSFYNVGISTVASSYYNLAYSSSTNGTTYWQYISASNIEVSTNTKASGLITIPAFAVPPGSFLALHVTSFPANNGTAPNEFGVLVRYYRKD